ncbi:hypothetical protein JCM8097_005973 [Rhodosporidiobolus ruineniae]
MPPPERQAAARPPPQRRPTTTLRVLDQLVLPGLRLVQNASAAAFTVFGVLHLASPLSALLPSQQQYLSSAENRASGIQLLAREVYQGELSEPILVWGSLAAHILSGVALRWLQVLRRLEWRKLRREEVKALARESVKNVRFAVADEVEDMVDEAEVVATTTADEEVVVRSTNSTSSSLFPTPNFHQKTGYLLVPFLLHHLWVHRLLPSSPFPPISSLSPSFFSYSFVSLSLSHSSPLLRYASAFAYTATTLLATYHGLVGWRVLLDPTAPRSLAPRRKRAGEKVGFLRRLTGRREWQAAWVALVAGVAVGTARIAGYLGGERTVKVPEFVARRMEYVLRRGFGAA